MQDNRAIRIELMKRGTNLTQAALEAGLSSGACRTALYVHFPAGERALAKALDTTVEELFPERYGRGVASNEDVL